MIKRKVVFVVLTYRNTGDLEDFIERTKTCVKNYQIIIVNSYYDEESSVAFRRISECNNCDFIEVENRGYSYGNNVGIAFARDNYEFDYLIVSNADILIEKFDTTVLDSLPRGIYGGKITNLKGKAQNPMIVKENSLAERLIYEGFKKEISLLLYMGIALNKLGREIFLARPRHNANTVYQLHGSFLIFHHTVIKKWDKVFDENLFLFAEESCLAKRAKKESVLMNYIPQIEVLHKEDGSMIFLGKKVNERLKEANIYFYETYCQGE